MSERSSRRRALQVLAVGAVSLRFSSALCGADPALAPFDQLMTEFLRKHRVPGAALAVSRGSRVVYSRGFGFADVEARRAVRPDALFRIASVSKPLTAVAVMQLAERKFFALDDRVFGILPAEKWLSPKSDDRVRRITVRQLLQHTAGWDRLRSFDPITRPREAAKLRNKPLPAGPEDILRYALTLPLDHEPGTRYAYANVGYLLLGRLIEHASGISYERYVKENVLAPVGVTRMQLGRARKEDLAKDEVCYYDAKRRLRPAVNGPLLGVNVPIVYGGENFEAYEAHGGWIASAPDLVRFAAAFDNPKASVLLKANSIAAMFARPRIAGEGQPPAVHYGCGWSVRPVGNQGRVNSWHTGLIAGTSTLLVRRHDGLNWAVLFNTDANPAGVILADLIDPLVHGAADAVRRWPEG